MSSEDLSPFRFTQKRYTTTIPEGRLTHNSPSQIPVISRKSTGRVQPLSMRDIMTDSSMIDQKLKALSQNRDGDFKTNLKFLKYKFNPGNEEQTQNIKDDIEETYGQMKMEKQKITINTFYQHKNVLFKDERAPLVYKKLFLERQQIQ